MPAHRSALAWAKSRPVLASFLVVTVVTLIVFAAVGIASGRAVPRPLIVGVFVSIALGCAAANFASLLFESSPDRHDLGLQTVPRSRRRVVRGVVLHGKSDPLSSAERFAANGYALAYTYFAPTQMRQSALGFGLVGCISLSGVLQSGSHAFADRYSTIGLAIAAVGFLALIPVQRRYVHRANAYLAANGGVVD
jgi:hypothetical protein